MDDSTFDSGPDLRELYQEVIFDHYRRPRHFGHLAQANRSAEGHNPLCGDRIELELQVGSDGRIDDVAFSGEGCAISTASASLMTEAVKGKDRAAIQSLYEQIHTLLTQQNAPANASLGKLAALAGVSEFPARVKCATLCWHTLNAALERSADAVTTE